jgi:hypothetical protein
MSHVPPLAALPVVALLSTLVACGGDESAALANPELQSSAAHAHAAPNGGKLIELGEHFANLELLYEPATGLVRVLVLDAHAERYVRSGTGELVLDLHAPAGVELRLVGVASTLTGETSGDTARFEGTLTTRPLTWSARLREIELHGQRFASVELGYP